MHQCLVQWVGDKIEIVPGDSSYVIWVKDFLNVADYEIPPIQAVDSDEEF